eukprot:scaffold56567_cov35-Tisochrysis_lutea.AAC.4
MVRQRSSSILSSDVLDVLSYDLCATHDVTTTTKERIAPLQAEYRRTRRSQLCLLSLGRQSVLRDFTSSALVQSTTR